MNKVRQFFLLLVSSILIMSCNSMSKQEQAVEQETYNDEQYDKPLSEEAPMLSIDDYATIEEEYSVKAEVFRVVNKYYKDALRKETISIVRLSNGITILKSYLHEYRYTAIGREQYSSLPGYEYQCISMKGNDIKVYAYNESDKKLVEK